MPGWSTHAGPMEHQEQRRDGPGEVTPGILMIGMSGNRPGNELRPACEARNPKTSETLQIPSFEESREIESLRPAWRWTCSRLRGGLTRAV